MKVIEIIILGKQGIMVVWIRLPHRLIYFNARFPAGKLFRKGLGVWPTRRGASLRSLRSLRLALRFPKPMPDSVSLSLCPLLVDKI